MSRTLAIYLVSLMAAAPLLSHADVYKCTSNGKVTFSDLPCRNGAKPMELDVYMPPAESVAKAKKQTQDMEQNLAASQKQHQIDALKSEMEAQKLKMDRELGTLKSNKKVAANDQASASGENRNNAEMQAVARRYQDKINALNSQITALQAK